MKSLLKNVLRRISKNNLLKKIMQQPFIPIAIPEQVNLFVEG